MYVSTCHCEAEQLLYSSCYGRVHFRDKDKLLCLHFSNTLSVKLIVSHGLRACVTARNVNTASFCLKESIYKFLFSLLISNILSDRYKPM